MKQLKKLKKIGILTLLTLSLTSLSHAQDTKADGDAAANGGAVVAPTPNGFDDAAMTARVKKQLLTSKEDLKGVSVSTSQGTVTLTGFLPNEEKKALAGQLAAQAAGEPYVKNNIAIDKSQSSIGSYISDSTITTKIKAKLLGNSEISASDITVTTKNGNVLLSGRIPSKAQLDKVISLVKETSGVTKVDNKVQVDK